MNTIEQTKRITYPFMRSLPLDQQREMISLSPPVLDKIKELEESHKRLLAAAKAVINLGEPRNHEAGCVCVVCEGWAHLALVGEQAEKLTEAHNAVVSEKSR